jgi:ParB family chromosome partitioning protein
MCLSEHRPPAIVRLLASSATKRSTTHNAESIRAHGVLSPLLVRPKGERFEIVFGAQRHRAAQMADAATVPVSIREMTDAQVLEAQLVENLQRHDVHALEEAQGFAALLKVDDPKYSIEQIAAKCGKTPAYRCAIETH